MQTLNLGETTVDVVLKDIKNVHLSVYPPTGRVRISAPSRMSVDTIRVFAISKLGWIRQQQKKIREQDRETPREYLERESHYLWGKRYLLVVAEVSKPQYIELNHSKIVLYIRPGSTDVRKQALMDNWYREQIRHAAQQLIAKWEPLLGVKVSRLFVRQMKTKWGSCNSRTGSIRLNTELAKKPRQCLEYIIVHEMIHLLEPTHNARFVTLMDKFMPHWQFLREKLNSLPVRHEEWIY